MASLGAGLAAVGCFAVACGYVTRSPFARAWLLILAFALAGGAGFSFGVAHG